MKNKFFFENQVQQILAAIQEAENKTSGEIRLHVENRCWGDSLKRAAFVFKKLNMQNTKQRNGVLLYIAIQSHKYAIFSDQGINEKTPEYFWEAIIKKMLEYFQRGELVEGICYGIEQIGANLQKYFPGTQDDENELSNEISTGNLDL